MSVRSAIVEFATEARAHPVAVALEVGTFVACLVLFGGTLVALTRAPPTGRGDDWLALIGLGAAIALLWTFVVPLAERYVLQE